MPNLGDKEECDIEDYHTIPEPVTKKKQPPQDTKEEYIQEINILLLGETGVGKSTFINAFVNYLTYQKLSDAEKEELICLIPAKFSITDDNYELSCTVEIGKSDNECQQAGASSTQGCKSYLFHVDDVKVRLIDTPGIGDTRGIDQDDVNFENIISYLGEFEKVHAICVLLKPNNARLTIVFQYCVKQLLSRLQKSASRNIVFLFTNSRSTFYRPGDTFIPLKEILNEVRTTPPFVDIPFSKTNIFCIDNEAFRFLAALKHMSFSADEKKEFEKSWKKSSDECWRMLKYVAGIEYNGLIPHRIQDTVSINEARRIIIRLAQPLAEVAQLIQSNLVVLERHINLLKANADNVKELEGKLYVPVITVRTQGINEPYITCTAAQCIEVYQVSNTKHTHYKKICYKPNHLQRVPPKEVIGSPELIPAMGGTQNCNSCGCSYLTHMYIYYATETYEDKIADQNIEAQIANGKIEANTVQDKIQEIEDRSKDYESEQDTIIKTIAKFAHFLQNNAITPYNDAYKQYLQYLIDRERNLGDGDSKEMLNRYQNMLVSYTEEKKILDEAFEMAKAGSFDKIRTVTADDVLISIQSLYSLKHTGDKIKELHEKQEQARSKIANAEEYIHPRSRKPNRWLRLVLGR